MCDSCNWEMSVEVCDKLTDLGVHIDLTRDLIWRSSHVTVRQQLAIKNLYNARLEVEREQGRDHSDTGSHPGQHS